MSGAEAIGVYVVDLRPIWRVGVQTALAGQDFTIVGEAADCAAALHDGRSRACDVLVTSWPPLRLEWAEPPNLRRVPTLALLRQGADAAVGVAALKIGAAACLYDDVSPDDLRSAVRLVHEGGCIVDPRLTQAVSAQFHGDGRALPELSETEAEVAACIATGWTNREIAHATGIPERTVVTAISSLLQKLGLPTRSAVAAWWIRQGGQTRS